MKQSLKSSTFHKKLRSLKSSLKTLVPTQKTSSKTKYFLPNVFQKPIKGVVFRTRYKGSPISILEGISKYEIFINGKLKVFVELFLSRKNTTFCTRFSKDASCVLSEPMAICHRDMTQKFPLPICHFQDLARSNVTKVQRVNRVEMLIFWPNLPKDLSCERNTV